MNNEDEKTSYFKKSMELESVLKEINSGISGLYQEKLSLPKQPIVLLMGCARSGGTLMLQYLASTGLFSYPTNLIARFHSNPYFGILVQKALIESDPLNQMGFNLLHDGSHKSELGKTIGALEPSEFWYFWRNYFRFTEINQLTETELQSVNSENFLMDLGAFEQHYSMPLAMKGAMMNWNIPYLYSISKNFIFINLTRERVFNAQSLLLAREKYFNDRNKWYSFKPPEYSALKNLNPLEQVAGQVYFTTNAVSEGLSEIPESNKIELTYTEFCNSPELLLIEIKKRFEMLGNSFQYETQKSKIFRMNEHIRINQMEFEKLSEYCENFPD